MNLIYRSETILSSIQTQIWGEKMRIKGKDKSENYEYLAAKVVFEEDLENNQDDKDKKQNDLQMFNQTYRSPFVSFGYQKNE